MKKKEIFISKKIDELITQEVEVLQVNDLELEIPTE